MSQYQDKEIVCAEPGCGTFIWRAKDQQFFAEKGFSAPKRCKVHAAERRAHFNNAPQGNGRNQDRGNRKPRYEDRERDADILAE